MAICRCVSSPKPPWKNVVGTFDLLEHVAERPVGERVRLLAAAREHRRQVGRVVGGVVDRVVGSVGGVELRDVHRQAGQRGVGQVLARPPELVEQVRRGLELLVGREGDDLRLARRVGVRADEVDRHVVAGDELREGRPPGLGTRRGRRSADLEQLVDLLDRARRGLVQAEVGLLVGVLPEEGEVRLVPDLDRPAPDLLDPVALDEVAQHGLDEGDPLRHVSRRRDVALPPEDRLLA